LKPARVQRYLREIRTQLSGSGGPGFTRRRIPLVRGSAPTRWSSMERLSRRAPVAPGRGRTSCWRGWQQRRGPGRRCRQLTRRSRRAARSARPGNGCSTILSHRRAIRTASDTAKGLQPELPRLDDGPSGPSAGRPRVYDIALEIVSHGDGRIDAETVSRSWRLPESHGLKLGELWRSRSCCGWQSSRIFVVSACESPPMGAAKPADSWADQIMEAERMIEEPDPGDRGHGALKSADGQRLRRGVGAPSAGSGPRVGLAADLDFAGRPRPGLPLTWIEHSFPNRADNRAVGAC